MNIKTISLFLSLLIFLNIQCNPRLIGLYNGLNENHYKVEKESEGTNLISGTIIPEGYYNFKPEPLSALSPMRFNVIHKNDIFTIRIEKSDSASACKGTEVVAYIESKRDIQSKACVPSIKSLVADMNSFTNQNFILVLAPSSEEGSDIPFKFELSSWTSLSEPWNQQTITHPAFQSINNNNDDLYFSKPLQILQGYSAWGDANGYNPRLGFPNIMNIYNDTKYSLYIKRNSKANPYQAQAGLNTYNFEKIVPPFCAVPKAGVWVPYKDIKSKEGEVVIYILSPPAPNINLEEFEPITSAGSFEIGLSEKNIDDVIDSMQEAVPNFVSQVTNQPDLSNLMSDKKSGLKYGSKYYFKIYTTQNNKINIEKCRVNPKNKTPNCAKIKSIENATSGNLPNYFRLIVNEENKDGKNNVNLDIDQVSTKLIIEEARWKKEIK